MILTAQDKRSKRVDKVLLDGVDVTNRCFFFNDNGGIVKLYVKDKDGNFKINATHDGVVTETLKGEVEVIWQAI
jgi:hypothetical protein